MDITVTCRLPLGDLASGASVACHGICMTVVESGEKGGASWFRVMASPETLSKSRVESWQEGHRIHVEPSLRMGDPIGGHITYGHVDGVGMIRSVDKQSACLRIVVALDGSLMPLMVARGSVAVDGVSLTVVEVHKEEKSIALMVIPHTLQQTTLARLHAGDKVHIEADMMARYLVNALGEIRGCV